MSYKTAIRIRIAGYMSFTNRVPEVSKANGYRKELYFLMSPQLPQMSFLQIVARWEGSMGG